MRTLSDEQWDRFLELVQELTGLDQPHRDERLSSLKTDGRESPDVVDLAHLHFRLPPADPGEILPEVLGFEIVREIGRGGMGVVYEARDLSLQRQVAIKLLPALRVGPGEYSERFRREALAGARLHHAGIVAVHAVGECGKAPYIVQELVPGSRTLSDEISDLRSGVGVPPDHYQRVAELIALVADALHVAHENGVVHRDVKPGNILMTPAGKPKLADFGLAQLRDAPELTRTGWAAGSPYYMSPEQTLGLRVDARTDVFSLGAVLFEMLTLARPFEGDSTPQILQRVVSAEPIRPRLLRAEVPADLEVICLKALAKEPEQRFESAAAFAADLRRFLSGEPIHAHPPSVWTRLRKWIRRSPAKAAAAAAAGLAFAALAGLSLSAYWNSLLYQRVTKLALSRELEALTSDAGELWPSNPDKLPAYEDWLNKAGALTAQLPSLRKDLDKLQAHLSSLDDEERWWYDQLSELVKGIEAFANPDTGLIQGISPQQGWGIARRNAWAEQVREMTLDGPSAASLWGHAIASIGDRSECPAYRGMDLKPQLGLLPIGQDPHSQLWEFSAPQTGDVAARNAAGEILLTPETGLVFVLLPGAVYEPGAQPENPSGRHYDPNAQPDEAPGATVTLQPFFMSKYEMTQAQWKTITGDNPSAFVYEPDQRSVMRPVENISCREAMEVLGRIGLAIPTEVQWEYGARGGTDTPWFTGNDSSTMEGAANLADLTCKRTPGAGSEWEFADWEDGWGTTCPVGLFFPNGYGLHDTAGNVWEMCCDVRTDYSNLVPGTGEQRATGKVVVSIRGGDFQTGLLHLRVTYRASEALDDSFCGTGIRPIRVID